MIVALVAAVVSSVLLQCYVVSADEISPSTMRLMVTKNALDYMGEIVPSLAAPLIKSLIKGWEIPITSHLSLQNLYLNELKIEHAKFFSNPLTGLNLQLSEVNVSMRAHVCLTHWHWTVVINASLSDILLAAKVKKDSEGQPVFNITHCSINFSSILNVDDNFFNFPFKKLFVKNRLQHFLESDFICKHIPSNTNDAVRNFLLSHPAIKLDAYSEVSYALIGEPIFTNDYIISEHKVEILTTKIPATVLPFKPTSFSSPELSNCKDKMICVWISDYVLNTAFVVYKRAGKMVYNITEDVFEDDDNDDENNDNEGGITEKLKVTFFKLDTSTFSLIVPQLFHRYPNRNLTLTARAVNEAPSVSITDTQTEFKIAAAVDVYVNDTEQGNFPVAFTMGMMVRVNASLGIANGTENRTLSLTANVIDVDVCVDVCKSNIGEINYHKINKLIHAFHLVRDHILPSLNKRANLGHPVQLPKGLMLVAPKLTHLKGRLQLETDIDYKHT